MKNTIENNSSKRKKKKKKRRIKITITFLILLVILICVGLFWGENLLSKMKRTKIDETDLGISKEVTEKLQTSEINDIVNIAFFGVDETEDDNGRSDAMMIATFDPIHKKLKVTSIMRDTCINIPDGYGYDKANHAYAYGGPQLAIKNLNQNFGLNITDYVKVNFEDLEGLVDAIGGIEMRLTDVEINEVNKYIERMSRIQTVTSGPVVKNDQGRVHLNGFQALGYTRDRSSGRGDFDRTERQRKIVSEIFERISSAGTAKLASMATKLMPYVETSLTNKEIINLGANVLGLGTSNIEQERFPRDGYWDDAKTPSLLDCLAYDEEYTAKQISEYIFNDKKLWEEGNEPEPYIKYKKSYVAPNNNNNNNTNTNNEGVPAGNSGGASTTPGGTGGTPASGEPTETTIPEGSGGTATPGGTGETTTPGNTGIPPIPGGTGGTANP